MSGTLTDALITSGACAFAPGVALRVRTGGSVDPFELFPALQGWLQESPADLAGAEDWWEHPDLARLEEIAPEDYEALSLDPSRIILIDDDLCGVCSAMIGSGPTAERRRILLLAEWEFSGDLTPRFFDLWATVATDNGYGWGRHALGEVVPGLMGSVDKHEGIPAYLALDPLPESDRLYAKVLSWIAGCVGSTPKPNTGGGFDDFELLVRGSAVAVNFPEEGPYVEAQGWIGPTVTAHKPVE